MTNKLINRILIGVLVGAGLYSCAPKMAVRSASKDVPNQYATSGDTTNSANVDWKNYFQDENLIALIDTALQNNQELNIFLQEVEMLRNEVRARKGEYLPSVGVGAGAGLDKVGRYTRYGALEANNEIKPGEEFPEPLGDYMFGAFATWEVDIWKKLRNAKKSAFTRYLAGIDGRNFLVTNLIAEIASSYYELLALDNQLEIVEQNITIQSDAFEVVKLRKQSARVTELAVRRFEAQLLDTRSLQYNIRQQIIEVENRINFLVGRFPKPVQRNADFFNQQDTDSIQSGIPSQLLENRPDIRQAELELAASKLDVSVAKARFYPSLGISAGIGYQAFNPEFLLETPESMLYYLGADLVSPLINRNAIKAAYFNANAAQLQAIFNYERTILNAYIEVANQMANIGNLQSSYELKEQQVEALTESINISNSLFQSARADYMEVLLTQREALDARFDLIETKMNQKLARVSIYRALGGGWK